MKLVYVALIVLLVSGCMSQTLKGYMGQDVSSVMVDLGPPHNAFDLPDGRRAFQWIQNRTYSDPVSATTTEVSKDGKHKDWLSSTTVISGGRTVEAPCFYTVYGEKNEATGGWTVVDFQRPKIECE